MADCRGRRRFRLVRRWTAPARPVPGPQAAPAPRPADLDNPYGPCYTRARSLEELRSRKNPKQT